LDRRVGGLPNLVWTVVKKTNLCLCQESNPGCHDHSLPFNGEVKKTWSYIFTPPYAFMVSCLRAVISLLLQLLLFLLDGTLKGNRY
jgi:hypothetical protein